jgi:hypothetical protein
VLKLLYGLLSTLIGGWFVFDGIHVLATGRYFGPPQPGPWSGLVRAAGIDPFALGVPFVLLGGLWFAALLAVLTRRSWGRGLGLAVAIASLWYAPIGTVVSLVLIALLMLGGKAFGRS